MTQAQSSRKCKTGGYAKDIVTVVRAFLSVLLLILAYSINASAFLSVLILAAAALISGFDIILDAVDNAQLRAFASNVILKQ